MLIQGLIHGGPTLKFKGKREQLRQWLDRSEGIELIDLLIHLSTSRVQIKKSSSISIKFLTMLKLEVL